jgi:hypothetical protein
MSNDQQEIAVNVASSTPQPPPYAHSHTTHTRHTWPAPHFLEGQSLGTTSQLRTRKRANARANAREGWLACATRGARPFWSTGIARPWKTCGMPQHTHAGPSACAPPHQQVFPCPPHGRPPSRQVSPPLPRAMPSFEPYPSESPTPWPPGFVSLVPCGSSVAPLWLLCGSLHPSRTALSHGSISRTAPSLARLHLSHGPLPIHIHRSQSTSLPTLCAQVTSLSIRQQTLSMPTAAIPLNRPAIRVEPPALEYT